MAEVGFGQQVETICIENGAIKIEFRGGMACQIETLFGKWVIQSKEDDVWCSVITEFIERKKLDHQAFSEFHGEMDKPLRNNGRWINCGPSRKERIEWLKESAESMVRLSKLKKLGKLW